MAAYLRHKGLRRVKVSERVMSSIEWLRNVFFFERSYSPSYECARSMNVSVILWGLGS